MTLVTYSTVVKQVPQVAAGLAIAQESEVTVAYYVDSPSDEEGAVAIEAEVDFRMGDMEQLFQEQLESLAEDVAEHEAAQRKGKAMATEPSIMAIEEDPAVAAPTRLDELITL